MWIIIVEECSRRISGRRLIWMVQAQVWVIADGMDEDLQWKKCKPITCTCMYTSVIDSHYEHLLWLSLSWLLADHLKN